MFQAMTSQVGGGWPGLGFLWGGKDTWAGRYSSGGGQVDLVVAQLLNCCKQYGGPGWGAGPTGTAASSSTTRGRLNKATQWLLLLHCLLHHTTPHHHQ